MADGDGLGVQIPKIYKLSIEIETASVMTILQAPLSRYQQLQQQH